MLSFSICPCYSYLYCILQFILWHVQSYFRIPFYTCLINDHDSVLHYNLTMSKRLPNKGSLFFPPDLFRTPFWYQTTIDPLLILKYGHCPWPSCFKGLSFFSARFIHNPLKWCSIKAGSLSLAILFSNRARGGHRTLAAMSRRCRRGPSRTLQNRSV